jgi:pimeloyl-ACP methyl ester carboxylesterase
MRTSEALRITVQRGRKALPWALFVHGLGMGSEAWLKPEKARVLGGLAPLSAMVREGIELRSLWHDLKESGYTVAAWDQRRPIGEIAIAVAEMREVLQKISAENPGGIIVIGHSRGGLVARKCLEEADSSVIGYVSVATPHKGSSLARWQKYLEPFASFVRPLVKDASRSRLLVAVKRVASFIESPAVKELLPGSEFLTGIGKQFNGNVFSVSAGGTDPHLFSVMGVPFPKALGRILPDEVLPEEFREGMGDGLVTAISSFCRLADSHMDFPVNHVEMMYDRRVREALMEKITAMS